ncbi:MAG: YdcF family protein [Actinomycetota bacterium]
MRSRLSQIEWRTFLARWRRVLTVMVALVVVAGVAFTILSYRWFVNPTEQEPESADVIYVLGGGGPRMEYAVELVREGVSNRVVFSSTYLGRVWAATPCNRRPVADVPSGTIFECLEADPSTTRGEAQLLAELAEDRGWERVIVVASTDQVTRARRLIERCWDGEALFTSVSHDQPTAYRVAYEWGASIKATFLRGC